MLKPINHSFYPKVLLLLVNTGSPSSPTKKAIKDFLLPFLSDRRVIQLHPLLWQIILRLFILPRRPSRLVDLYKSIWLSNNYHDRNSSPLLYYTESVAKTISIKYDDRVITKACFLYSKPTLQEVIAKAYKEYLPRSIIVLPLFPQLSAVTHGAVADSLSKSINKLQIIPTTTIINGYYDNQHYLKAISNTINNYWKLHSKPEHLIFSWHGIPLKYFEKGDAYYCFCVKTTREIAKLLSLDESEYSYSFQSRFGLQKWLQPYTIENLSSQSKKHKSIDIISPGFATDCLETMYELVKEVPKEALRNSDVQYRYIPCLNTSKEGIDCYSKILEPYVSTFLKNNDA
ncbi:MAG: ferrochelatase [Methylacidiphilales bacterium]|nr:ferrochelatase [Candidatus Methylacidiphilales bacterium]